jgi:hypothetical protein
MAGTVVVGAALAGSPVPVVMVRMAVLVARRIMGLFREEHSLVATVAMAMALMPLTDRAAAVVAVLVDLVRWSFFVRRRAAEMVAVAAYMAAAAEAVAAEAVERRTE